MANAIRGSCWCLTLLKTIRCRQAKQKGRSGVTIAIIIVNYRTADLVVDCLASLVGERSDDLLFRVFVGDAASGDGSVDAIARAIEQRGWSDWASCDDIGRNDGFAFGNNHMVQTKVLPDPAIDFVHFLNPDTYIRPGAVRTLVDFLRSHPGAGIAGSRLENPDESPRAFAFRFPTPWREFVRGANLALMDRLLPRGRVKMPTPDAACPVDWVSGASFMVTRALLERIGLMDPGYFLYFEETDLMARAHAAGFEVWHVPASRVVHLAGQSTGVRTDTGKAAPPSPHWLASRRRYFEKHHGRMGALVADMAYVAGDRLHALKCLLRRRPATDRPPLWASYIAPWMGRRP